MQLEQTVPFVFDKCGVEMGGFQFQRHFQVFGCKQVVDGCFPEFLQRWADFDEPAKMLFLPVFGRQPYSFVHFPPDFAIFAARIYQQIVVK